MYYLGVDIGGTFTDCVLVDREGNHRTAKTLSTKDDPVTGVLAGLERLAETVGVDLTTLLERTERFGHGSCGWTPRSSRRATRPSTTSNSMPPTRHRSEPPLAGRRSGRLQR